MKLFAIKFILYIIFTGSVFSCVKSQYTAGALALQDKTYDTGPVLPELRIISNDTAVIVLAPNARVFYLDMKVKNSKKYLDLLHKAQKRNRPVRAKIFMHEWNGKGEEIAEIYPATKKDIELFKVAMRP